MTTFYIDQAAQPVIHALAKATLDSITMPQADRWYEYPVYFEIDAWPQLARELISENYEWPALQNLAAVPTSHDAALDDAQTELVTAQVKELLQQTAIDSLLPYWDMMCAVAARKWSLEQQERGEGAEPWAYASAFDAMWWTVRDVSDEKTTPGVKLIWRGMGLKEVIGFQDIDTEMIELLGECEKLNIAIPFSYATCDTILSATY